LKELKEGMIKTQGAKSPAIHSGIITLLDATKK